MTTTSLMKRTRHGYEGVQCQNADFTWAFGLNRLSLDIIGVWPNANDSERLLKLKNLRVPFMILWLVIGLLLPQIYALTQVFSILPLTIDNLTTSIAALTSSMKLFFLWNSRQDLRPIVNSITADWQNFQTLLEHEVMIKQARRARIFTISGYSIMFISFVGFIATPLFGLSIRIINNITDDPNDGRFFPLQTYYPFAATRFPLFELIYISQLIGGSFVGISYSVPDNFFGALVFHASGQCEIIEAKINKLLCEDIKPGIEHGENNCKFFQKNLYGIVMDHIRIIRFVNLLEKSFNLLILVQVISLSLTICCLGFGVIHSLENEGSLSFIQVLILSGTLLNLMLHMLVYCFASEILAKHSIGLVHAVYCSNWYLIPSKYSKDLILIMLRSKFPLRLTAGKFFYLSLNAYLNILRSSVGYISMLLAVNK